MRAATVIVCALGAALGCGGIVGADEGGPLVPTATGGSAGQDGGVSDVRVETGADVTEPRDQRIDVMGVARADAPADVSDPTDVVAPDAAVDAVDVADADAGAPCACLRAGDCASRVCLGGLCRSASCTDGARNGSELDVDCGGPACPKCANGKRCDHDGDCLSGVCACGGTCVAPPSAPTCTDGVRNGDETDVDCGGSCASCALLRCCWNHSCTSGWCVSGACRVPTCSDGVHNGDETDVDCGGSCPPCRGARSCQTSGDCFDGICYTLIRPATCGGTLSMCIPTSCANGVRDGDETGVDCGGTCPPCP
jgi:hypothetical protein